MDVSLIIPAYNEEQRISTTLSYYSEPLLSKYQNCLEILIVANGCHDRTAQVAESFASHCPQMRVINIPDPVGKGGAVLEGFRQACGQFILFADADGATHPISLFHLIEDLYQFDIAIGSRWMRKSRIIHRQPLKRRIFSRIFNISTHAIFHLPFHDTQCGAKAFRYRAAKKLSTVVKENRWTFDVDLLLWARFFGMSVQEVPVIWSDKPGSKLAVGTTGREVIASLLRLKLEKRRRYSDQESRERHNEVLQ